MVNSLVRMPVFLSLYIDTSAGSRCTLAVLGKVFLAGLFTFLFFFGLLMVAVGGLEWKLVTWLCWAGMR